MNFPPPVCVQRAPARSSVHGLADRSAFSVIELLTVMTLISMMAGFAVPALKGIVSGNAVDIGATEFGSLLGLARSEAIAQHTVVRFVVATGWPGQDADADLRRASLWSWHADPNSSAGGYFLQLTAWQELPAGLVLENTVPAYVQDSQYAQVDGTTVRGSCVLADSFATSAAFTAQTIQGQIYTRYIEFMPSGSARIPGITDRQAIFVAAQGYADPNGNVVHTAQANGRPTNWAQVNVDTLTGRAHIYRP